MALRAARDKAKLTQPKLADKAGLDWTTISQIENGASAPDLATMEAIADALGVPMDEAIGRAGHARRESISAFVDGLTPPEASSEAARPSLEDQWAAFRADLRPALLKLAEVLEQGSPEAQGLKRAIGESSPRSSGRRKDR
ncbi:MAG TPA: helix-turn-helix transcriptional regulator [Candidatus Cybelea sp.]